MRLRVRAAIAAMIGGTITVLGCSKSESDVEIPSLSDPVLIESQQEISTDSLESENTVQGLSELPSSEPSLELPETPAPQAPAAPTP